MTLKTIDNKQVDLTNDEWDMYQKICLSYDKHTYKGSQMFKDLFEVNSKGIIIFLNAPENYTSFEAIMFITNIYHHQHLRELYKRVDEAIGDLNKKEKELTDKLKSIKLP